MKNIAFVILGLFLTSCSQILFYDLQTCEGREINKIPKEFMGAWLDEGMDTIALVNNLKGFYRSKDFFALDGKNVKCFVKDDFYILNILQKNLWDVTIFKRQPDGDIHVWPLDFFYEAKILAEFPELDLIEWKDLDENTFRTKSFSVDTITSFHEAKIDGELNASSLKSISLKINPFIAKKSKITINSKDCFVDDLNVIYPAQIEPLNERRYDIIRSSEETSGAFIELIDTPGIYYALIIGNNEYDDTKINDLQNPVNDANKLHKLLTSEYTFDEENVILIENASRSEITRNLEDLRKKITVNDNLVIFYAGHGFWDNTDQQGWWLPTDAKKEYRDTWIENSTITNYISAIKSKHTLLISDACFSGGIFKTRSGFNDANLAINKLYAKPSRKAMTSGNMTTVPDESVFLKYLLKKLNENEEKYISSDALFYSFVDEVRLDPKGMEPQYGVVYGDQDEGGQFIFIKRD
jgi:hypothetical protein